MFFTSQSSPSKIQPRNRGEHIHTAPLQGHLAEKSWKCSTRKISPKFDGKLHDTLGREKLIDLLMGLVRGAVFRHGGGAQKQPIKQPTETPTSTLALMGRFPSLMGRFPALMGRFTDFVIGAVLPLENPLENSPLRKGALRGS